MAKEGILSPTGRAIKGHWSPSLARDENESFCYYFGALVWHGGSCHRTCGESTNRKIIPLNSFAFYWKIQKLSLRQWKHNPDRSLLAEHPCSFWAEEKQEGSYRHMGKAQDVRPRPRGFQKLLSHQNNEVSKRSFVEALQAKAATANGNKYKETLWWSVGVSTFRHVTMG